MIRFKKLSTKSMLPTRESEGAAGFDLHYIGSEYTLRPGDRHAFATGIMMEIQPTAVGIIKPRSGLAVDHGIDVLAGTIDSDFRGELKVVLINHGHQPVTFKYGDRVAQLVVTNYERRSVEVGSLSESERGKGGFGSTGK